jgi:hypothetical protein
MVHERLIPEFYSNAPEMLRRTWESEAQVPLCGAGGGVPLESHVPLEAPAKQTTFDTNWSLADVC